MGRPQKSESPDFHRVDRRLFPKRQDHVGGSAGLHAAPAAKLHSRDLFLHRLYSGLLQYLGGWLSVANVPSVRMIVVDWDWAGCKRVRKAANMSKCSCVGEVTSAG